MKKFFFILPCLAFFTIIHGEATGKPFDMLVRECASNVHPDTMAALVKTESQFNPYAVGVVHGHLGRQPRNLNEAISTVTKLDRQGKNFSMGLTQINKKNLGWLGLDHRSVFDPCLNLRAGAKILTDCYRRAGSGNSQNSLQKALSCYYSGNFRFGFTQDFKGQPSYVEKVINNVSRNNQSIEIPKIDPSAPIAAPASRTKVKLAKAKPKISIKKVQSAVNHQKPSWDVFNEL